MVAMVAHPFSVMLHIGMRASRDILLLSVSPLYYPCAVGVQFRQFWDLLFVFPLRLLYFWWQSKGSIKSVTLSNLIELEVYLKLIDVVCQYLTLALFIYFKLCWLYNLFQLCFYFLELRLFRNCLNFLKFVCLDLLRLIDLSLLPQTTRSSRLLSKRKQLWTWLFQIIRFAIKSWLILILNFLRFLLCLLLRKYHRQLILQDIWVTKVFLILTLILHL